jgi:tagatose-1,6-bisphosphate aldolase
MTTIGKYRHLSRATTPAGHFVIMAIDHRTNLLDKLNQHVSSPLSDAEFVAFKQAVIQALVPQASAVLTDPAYGIAAAVANETIRGQVGLLAPIEVTDYSLHPSQRTMEMIPNWSVRQIKMSGGDGVKLLLPYNPKSAHLQQTVDFVQGIVADCATYDIPFFLEPIPYALDPMARLSNAELLDISLEMCERFSTMQVDILKLPFPVDAAQTQDEDEWMRACEAVTQACTVPWALLSAGVDYDTFYRQSRVACQAGASGVIVGRAVWAEAVALQGDARHDFLQHTATQRMQQLAEVCAAYATPWHDKTDTPNVNIDWYEY